MRTKVRGTIKIMLVVMAIGLILTGCGVGEVKEIKSEEAATKAIYRVRDELAVVEREAQAFIDESRTPTDKVIEGYIKRVDKVEEQLAETESYSKVTENLGERYAAALKQIKNTRRTLKSLEEHQKNTK